MVAVARASGRRVGSAFRGSRRLRCRSAGARSRRSQWAITGSACYVAGCKACPKNGSAVASDRSVMLLSVDFGKSGDRMPASKSYQRFATRCFEEAHTELRTLNRAPHFRCCGCRWVQLIGCPLHPKCVFSQNSRGRAIGSTSTFAHHAASL